MNDRRIERAKRRTHTDLMVEAGLLPAERPLTLEELIVDNFNPIDGDPPLVLNPPSGYDIEVDLS